MHLSPQPFSIYTIAMSSDLLEWVGASAPPGKEERKTDSLEDTSKSADGNCVQWSLLSDDLSNERRSRASEENQGAEVGSTLVAESASSIDQSTNTVGLDGRANKGSSPCSSSGGSLL